MAKKNTPPIQNVMHEIIIYAANVLKNINKDIKTWIGDDFCCNLIKILKNVIYAWNCIDNLKKKNLLLDVKGDLLVIEEELKLLSTLKAVSLKQEAYLGEKIANVYIQLEGWINSCEKNN